MKTIPTPFHVYAEACGDHGKAWLRTINAGSETSSAELLIIGQIGASYWEDDGVRENEFRQALASIPVGRKITIGINSEGGSVQDGLGIFNAIRARKEDITCRIDGYACSIASVIAVAGGRTISPRTSVWMIHDPWSFCQGNSDDMRKAADMLDTHAETLVAAYKEKTGKDDKEIRDAMKRETWMSGDAAKSWGLVDETNDGTAALAHWKPSENQRTRIPAAVLNLITAASRESAQTKEDTMNRKAILALLAKHGAQVAADATDEALLAELNKLVEAKKIDAKEREAVTAKAPEPNAEIHALNERVAAFERENKRIREERDAERRQNIERDVDSCVEEGRIPVSARDSWVDRIVAEGAKALTELRSYAARTPGARPIITVGDGATTDVLSRAIVSARAPMLSWRRGNSVSGEARREAAYATERLVRKHRDQLVLAVSTNTIDSDLQRTVILSDMLRAFKRRIVPLGVFSTVYNNVPLRTEGGTAKVAVPYFALSTTASDNFEAATGYDVEMDTNDGAKDVTIDKRKYQQFSYSSETLSRQPYFNATMHLMLKAEQLAIDVWTDVLSLVTLANYGAAAKITPASAFDTDDVADLHGTAVAADWPDMGRSLVIDSSYETNLLKVPGLVNVEKAGTENALRNGSIGRLMSFDVISSPRVPSNSENLTGFITMPSAMVVATAPVEPAPGVRNLLVSYDLVMDPDTGIGFTYRHGGNDVLDRDYHVVEAAYGYALGETAALERITSA